MSRYTETVFVHPVHGERVYFCDTIGLDGDAVVYRARAVLREDPRNEGLDEREFAFEGFRSPQGPTDEERARPVSAKFVSERPASTPEIIPAPVLTVLPGGKKKAPVAW